MNNRIEMETRVYGDHTRIHGELEMEKKLETSIVGEYIETI